MEQTYFDGRSFESLGITVERVHDDLPEMRDDMEAKPGRHGSMVSSLTLAPREITLECRAFERRWQDFEELKDEVAAWLVTDTERVLRLRNHPGQHYLAHYSSITEGDRIGGTGIGGFEVAFVASDPLRYGEQRAFVLNATSKRHFDVGGTDRADMAIEVRNAMGDSKVLGLTLNGSLLRVALPDSQPHVVSFDCVGHLVRVDGEASGVTLDSDWPDFVPGRWRVSVSEGSGTATFSWTQRYR